jgi:hypothetical protein
MQTTQPVCKTWHEVRFHLLAGKHFKHWQIKTLTKGKREYEVNYYDPFQYQIIMFDCELHNEPKKAQKVFETQSRDVCGRVRCRDFSIQKADSETNLDCLTMVVYDPKVQTYWHFENQIDNIDGTKFDQLFAIGKRVYCERS